ncbi:MAG TPA: TetR/AcrR family transcriptional regulator [Stellaceae bacterium]|nr:TetR/AcrR family transcriptional regulator [Stellaceae bacterium]
MPQLERGKARVAALMAAAAAVFAEKGYDTATMTEIAAGAGASIGSLYQFFPTKELLAAALHEAYLERLSGELDRLREEAAGRPAAELGDQLFERLADFLAQRPAFVALAERRDIDKARKRATRALLRRQIAAILAQAAPPLPPGAPEVMAVVILHLMRAMITLSGDDEEVGPPAVAVFRRMLRAYLAG